jgi:hypothetical protein
MNAYEEATMSKAEIVPIDRLIRLRRWAMARKHYAPLKQPEVKALSNSELVKAYAVPEVTAYGRAWYEQRAEQFRQYSEMSPWQLLEMSVKSDDTEYALLILEMDRRAQREGFVAIAEWLDATLKVNGGKR